MGTWVQCFWLCHYRLVRRLHSCSRNPNSSPSRSLECSLQASCRSLALWFRHGWTGACTSCSRYMQGLPHESLKSWFGMVIKEFLVFLFLPHESLKPWFGMVIEEILVFLFLPRESLKSWFGMVIEEFLVFLFLPHESLRSWFGMVIEEILVFFVCLFFAPWIPQILIWDSNCGNSHVVIFWLVTWPTW